MRLISVIIFTVAILNSCSRTPLFDFGYNGGQGMKRPQKVVQKNIDGDNTLIIIAIDSTHPDTTYHLTLKGDTLYYSIKLPPDTTKQ